MAPKKKPIPSIAAITDTSDLSVNDLLNEYYKICGSKGRVSLIKNQFSDDEIRFFVEEIKSQKDSIDTDNPTDIAALEQAAQLRIQINRLLRLQRDKILNAELLKGNNDPGSTELALQFESDALRTTSDLKDLHNQWDKVTRLLSTSREQRIKRVNETRINLTSMISQLDDIEIKNKIGIYGELLKKSMNKKKTFMISDKLINVTNDIEIPKNEQKEEDISKET